MPLVVYSVLRLLIFAIALVVLAFVGMDGWLLVLVGALIAFLLSYLMLRRQRDAAALYLAERAARRQRTGERFGRAVEEDAATEDAAVDAAADAMVADIDAKQPTPDEPGVGEPGAGGSMGRPDAADASA